MTDQLGLFYYKPTRRWIPLVTLPASQEDNLLILSNTFFTDFQYQIYDILENEVLHGSPNGK